jgi:hypothetical protein
MEMPRITLVGGQANGREFDLLINVKRVVVPINIHEVVEYGPRVIGGETFWLPADFTNEDAAIAAAKHKETKGNDDLFDARHAPRRRGNDGK